MIRTRQINCLGATMLGGALLSELGISYLQASVPDHDITLLITSDQRVFWQDMQHAQFNRELLDEDIVGVTSDGRKLTIEEIVNFSRNPNPKGILFDIESEWYKKNVPWIGKGRKYINVFEPRMGQKIMLLNNIVRELYNNGHYNEAIEALKQAIVYEPNYDYPYSNLGHCFQETGQYPEAIEAYRKAVYINPQFTTPYYGLGDAFIKLGRKQEAIECYQRFLNLEDPKRNKKSIKEVKEKILRLRNLD